MAWPIFATRSVTAPTVNSSPCFNTCSPVTRLPLTIRPVGTAQIAEHELAADLVQLAMAPAHLCRLDADDTIVVAPEARHVVGQLECRGGASAPHDLEYIIHRRWPVGFCDVCRRDDWTDGKPSYVRLSDRAPGRK